MKYYLIAGEASGDLHGSNLIKGLKEADNKAQFRCWGGDLMQQAGAQLVRHYKESAIMGFVEVLVNLNKINDNFKLCKKDLIEYSPDILILIDYPGFNLRMAKYAKKHNIKVFYYISPKVWAWKENRVELIRKYVDKLFIIFPFEIEYFKSKGIDAIYRGNPLLDSTSNFKGSEESYTDFCKRLNLDSNKKTVALMAGSRKSEIKYLLPRMLKTIHIYNNTNIQYVLACAPSIDKSFYDKIIIQTINLIKGDSNTTNVRNFNFSMFYKETYPILKHSSAAIISSGTASLEAALLCTPQVVCYGGNEISYRIARCLVKLKYISLANLILDKAIFKELLQTDCTPNNISKELDLLLNSSSYRNAMIDNYKLVIHKLGDSGASKKIALAMIEQIKL